MRPRNSGRGMLTAPLHMSGFVFQWLPHIQYIVLRWVNLLPVCYRTITPQNIRRYHPGYVDGVFTRTELGGVGHFRFLEVKYGTVFLDRHSNDVNTFFYPSSPTACAPSIFPSSVEIVSFMVIVLAPGNSSHGDRDVNKSSAERVFSVSEYEQSFLIHTRSRCGNTQHFAYHRALDSAKSGIAVSSMMTSAAILP